MKKVRCKTVLIPFYTPHSGYSEEEIEKATQEFSEFLGKIPVNNTTVIIGADLNASIGTRTTDDPQRIKKMIIPTEIQEDTILELLEPHGNPREMQMARES